MVIGSEGEDDVGIDVERRSDSLFFLLQILCSNFPNCTSDQPVTFLLRSLHTKMCVLSSIRFFSVAKPRKIREKVSCIQIPDK